MAKVMFCKALAYLIHAFLTLELWPLSSSSYACCLAGVQILLASPITISKPRYTLGQNENRISVM